GRGDGDAAGAVDHARGGGGAGGRAGGHRRADRRAGEDARRVRQAAQDDGRAAAREPGGDVRRAEGRVLRVPGSVGVHRQEDARGEDDRERRAPLRVADRGGEGGGGDGIGVRRARLRAAFVCDLDEERRGGRAPDGRGAAQIDVKPAT